MNILQSNFFSQFLQFSQHYSEKNIYVFTLIQRRQLTMLINSASISSEGSISNFIRRSLKLSLRSICDTELELIFTVILEFNASKNIWNTSESL